MSDVDFDKIVEYKEDFVNYEGFLPLFIRAIIMKQWSKHLLKKGLYDNIIQECVDTKPHNYDDAVNELKDWCKENPKYKNLIK